MPTNNFDGLVRVAAGTFLMALALAGCDKPAPQATPPEPPEQSSPAPAIPDVPAAEPVAPAVPAPEAPPPTEPSTVPKPASSNEPRVESMLAAIPSSKMGVAVDLKYSFDGEVLPNQPVMVHLAAVPRVGGSMKVSVQEASGLQMTASPLNVQKANASGVYRQQFSLTRGAGDAEPLRVLVIMEVGKNSAFGYFTIPLDTGTIPQKQESVKLR